MPNQASFQLAIKSINLIWFWFKQAAKIGILTFLSSGFLVQGLLKKRRRRTDAFKFLNEYPESITLLLFPRTRQSLYLHGSTLPRLRTAEPLR